MNFKSILGTLVLIFSLALISCEKEDQYMGYEMLPSSDILTAYKDSLSLNITMKTVADDSVRSSLITYMVGENNDAVLGRTRAGYVTRMYLNEMKGSLDEYTLDSVCFRLSKSSVYFYGDTTVSQTFSLYEITSDITVDDCKNYNQNTTTPSCLSSKNKICDIEFPAYEDTASSYQYKLETTYAQELYTKMLSCYSTESSLQTFDSLFIKQFKGIYLTTKDDGFQNVGATVVHCVPEITIYLKGADSTTTLVFAPSPQAYDEPLSTDDSQIYLQAINVFEHNYSTVVSSAIGKEQNVAYVQGLVGIKTNLLLNGLESWRDSVELNSANPVVINIAKLIVPLQSRSSWSDYLPLNFRVYDADRQLIYSTMSTTTDSTDFVFNIHSFLVYLFDNTKTSEEYSYEITVPENNAYGNGFVLDNSSLDKLKLLITYTK